MLFKSIALAAASVLISGQAVAQGFFPEGPVATKTAPSGNYRSFAVGVPVITFTGETVGRLEFNLGGHASLAVEANFKPKYDEVGEEEAAETGESLVTSGRGAALLFARYTNPAAMAGLYYAIGAGYREMDANWKVRAAGDDKDIDMSLVQDDDRLHHEAEMRGVTGHLRGGYRYIGTDIPLSIGAYFGLRHYQVGVKDTKRDDMSEADRAAYSDMSSKEKERLRRRFTTKLEPGIELGIAF
jgi:hypothetical protein